MMEAPTTARDGRSTEGLAPSNDSAQRALLVCRSPELRLYIQKGLTCGGFEFFTVTSLSEARDIICTGSKGEAAFGTLLLEMEDPLPQTDADALRRFCAENGEIPVIGVAPKPSADLVRESMVLGIRDFVTNPFNKSGIGEIVRSVQLRRVEGSPAAAVDERPGARETLETSESTEASGPAEDAPPEEFITKNEKMLRILDVVDRVAPTDSTVLILGESGTGKEVIARRIHQSSHRASGPFVEVHCGAIPPSLLESQLFGHEKGSFTGAFSRQFGLFEIADKGTIFLDEIAEMHLEMQVKLLRVLQERTFRRIGGRQNLHVDVRVLAATNRDLKDEVESKRFRADLYYRINVIVLDLPPLCERLEDIPALVEFFTRRLHAEKGLPLKSFTEDAINKLQKMAWVGNVREIENAVERLVLLSPGEIVQPADVDEQLEPSEAPAEGSSLAPTLTLDELKKIHIGNVLRANSGNKMKSARILGINVKTLYNLIQKLDIQM